MDQLQLCNDSLADSDCACLLIISTGAQGRTQAQMRSALSIEDEKAESVVFGELEKLQQALKAARGVRC